jgi:hypothetical protein
MLRALAAPVWVALAALEAAVCEPVAIAEVAEVALAAALEALEAAELELEAMVDEETRLEAVWLAQVIFWHRSWAVMLPALF